MLTLNKPTILQKPYLGLNFNTSKESHWLYSDYKKWQQYFPFRSKEIIKKSIYSLEKQNPILKKINKNLDRKTVDKLIPKNFSKKINLLTNREKECLVGYTFGRSIKKMSLSLILSPRTIETYILRSKNKLGIKDKEEIAEILLQYFDNKQLLEFLRN